MGGAIPDGRAAAPHSRTLGQFLILGRRACRPHRRDFREQIVNGLRRRLKSLDLVTAREAGLLGSTDPEVLAWAAERGRVLFSHDLRTLKGFAYERVGRGERMPGVFEVPNLMPIGQAIEELLLVIQLLEPTEIADRVVRLPL